MEVQVVLSDAHVQVFVVSPEVMLSPALFSSVMELSRLARGTDLFMHTVMPGPLCASPGTSLLLSCCQPAEPQGLDRQDSSFCLCQTWLF